MKLSLRGTRPAAPRGHQPARGPWTIGAGGIRTAGQGFHGHGPRVRIREEGYPQIALDYSSGGRTRPLSGVVPRSARKELLTVLRPGGSFTSQGLAGLTEAEAEAQAVKRRAFLCAAGAGLGGLIGGFFAGRYLARG